MTTHTGLADPADQPSILEQLQTLHACRSQLEREEAVLVRRARHEGIVWEQIASCLGVSKQAVHKKHAGWFNRRS